MAWVQLKNLFEEDKNYHGSIPETVEGILEKGEHFSLLPDEVQAEFGDMLGKKHQACDLFKTELNQPEWFLRTDGKFSNFIGNLLELEDGSMIFPKIFLFDISEWLLKQTKEKLQEIADYAFAKWANKRDEVTEKNDLLENDKFMGHRLRDMERQKEFFEKFPGK